MKKCHKCKQEQSSYNQFCLECGEDIRKTQNIVCDKCGSTPSTYAKFCVDCGTKIIRESN